MRKVNTITKIKCVGISEKENVIYWNYAISLMEKKKFKVKNQKTLKNILK